MDVPPHLCAGLCSGSLPPKRCTNRAASREKTFHYLITSVQEGLGNVKKGREKERK